jgi:NADPH2:quinone reductase
MEQLFYKIWPLFNARKIKPIIYKTMNINEAEKAHQIMSENNNIGKIVLEIS